jgi:hypothetical protein
VKLIKDIRYYEFAAVPAPGVGGAREGSLYALPPGATALGQRIALKLREAGVRIGPFDHLYVALTPALDADAVVDTGWGGEPWLRYVAAGLPAGFNALPLSDRLALLAARAFAAVRLLAPEAEPSIADTQGLVARVGSDVRIHLLRHTTRGFNIELSYTIAAPDASHPSQAWVAVTDLSSGRSGEAPFLDLEHFDDVFAVASRVTVKGRILEVHPRQSERAKRATSRYSVPIHVPIDDVLGA